MTEALTINLDAPCWLFVGYKQPDGYGRIFRDGKAQLAHRYFWQLMRGPIPKPLEIDHLCRVRHCVNPQHMEVVTHRENLIRSPLTLAGANVRRTQAKKDCT